MRPWWMDHDGGKRKRGAAGGVEGEVVYEGRYIVVVKERDSGLVAYPREVPKGREKEYLLLMVDETLAVLNELYKRTGNSMVRLSAAVVYGGEVYELVADKYIGVWVDSATKDYERFIRMADKVTMKFADRDVWLRYKTYLGRRIAVVKVGENKLYALARLDVWENRVLDPVSLMLAVIRDVMDELDKLEENWGYKAVTVQGYVQRNAILFVPVIYARGVVDMEPWYGDYKHFVRMADEVRLIPRR